MKKIKRKDECAELLSCILCEIDIMNTEKKAYLCNRIKGFLSGKGEVLAHEVAKELGLTYEYSVNYLLRDTVCLCEEGSPNKVCLADEGR